MLIDTLTSDPFAARVGKDLTIEAIEDELVLNVISVKENAMGTGPGAKRTPFSVILQGPGSPCLADGNYHLRVDDEDSWRLENIYLNRIIPPASTDGAGAFYQINFG